MKGGTLSLVFILIEIEIIIARAGGSVLLRSRKGGTVMLMTFILKIDLPGIALPSSIFQGDPAW